MTADEKTASIPIKRRVLVSQLDGGIYLVAPDDAAPSMATSSASMHEALNTALGIVPAKRARSSSTPKPKLTASQK